MTTNPTLFKKGNPGNPKGRGKGTPNKAKAQFIEIQRLAANDAHKTYGLLLEAMAAGEAWAHQIYWKTLYAVPKKSLEDVVEVKLPKDIEEKGVEKFLSSFIGSLRGFEQYSKR